jgi:hypothetical protein
LQQQSGSLPLQSSMLQAGSSRAYCGKLG